MKKLYSYMLAFAVLMALGTSLSSCGDDDENSPQEQGKGNGTENQIRINLPQGWFVWGGEAEWLWFFTKPIEECVDVGDYDRAVANANEHLLMDVGIIVTGRTTFESLEVQGTTTKPSEYFWSKTYTFYDYQNKLRSFTIYLYLSGVFGRYNCVVENGEIVVKDEDGKSCGTLTYTDNEIKWLRGTYKKVNH